MSFKITEKNTKHVKYAQGKNPDNLMDYQKNKLDEIRIIYPKLFIGYQLKEGLLQVFQCKSEDVEEALKKWLSQACRCRIAYFVKLSQKTKA